MNDINKSRSLELATNRFFKEFLDDDNINEICYNGDGSIWTLDIKSKWEEHKKAYTYNDLITFATPLASHKEDTLKANKPILSATLNSGERVQVVIPPATKKGMMSITIRKPSKVRYTKEDYKAQGMFDDIRHEKERRLSPEEQNLINLYNKKEWDTFLSEAVKIGKNIVIAGATGSGKTTYMKSLIDDIPLHERLITIEDTEEISFYEHKNFVQLFYPSEATGSGKTTYMKSLIDDIPLHERLITIEDTEEISFYEHKNFVQLFYPSEAKSGDPVTSAILLKSCLRMKPDRILLAELRGAEAYDYLQVLSSGHGGSITSVHAGSCSLALKRLSSMAGNNPSAKNISSEQLNQDFRDVIDIVVHIEAHSGVRKFSDVYFKGAIDENKVT
jgi:type IV secretion system protein VirB11